MFFDRFKKLCDERGISVYKACTDIGLNRSAVNKWKNGGLPNGATVAKFAKYFNVSADYLFGNVNDPFFYLDNDRILSEINSYVDEETPTLSKQDERNITKALETIQIPLTPPSRNRADNFICPVFCCFLEFFGESQTLWKIVFGLFCLFYGGSVMKMAIKWR